MTRWKLVTIFAVSLLTRIWFFGGLLSRFGHEKLITLTYDVGMYNAAAKMITESLDFSHRAVVIFGPGYPTFLALIGGWVNLDLVYLTLVQVLLSALSSVMLTLYIYKLTRLETLAFGAGLLNALSLLAIGLSGVLLSGSLYFFLLVSALYLVELGVETGRHRWFAISGIILALSLLTRSIGVYFPVVLLVITFLRIKPVKLFSRSMIGPLIGFCIPVVVALSWSTYNHYNYGFSEVAISTPSGLSKGVCLVRSEAQDITYTEAKDQFFAELVQQEEYLESGYDYALSVYTRRALMKEFFAHPFVTVWALAGNAFENMTADSGGDYLRARGESLWTRPLIRLVEAPAVKYRTLILALIGLLIIITQKKYRLAIILTLICAYYGAAGAFALDQGARIFYPAQIAWSVLIAVTLTESYRFLHTKRKNSTRSQPN